MTSAAYPQRLRLATPAAFKRVFDSPECRVSSGELVLLARSNQLPYPRLGLVISKKSCRLATQRNRVKRLLREMFRHRQHELGGIDIVILSRSGLASRENAAITEQSNRLCTRLLKRLRNPQADVSAN